MATKKTTRKQKPFQERIQAILKKEQTVYESAGIVRRFVIMFPNRQKAPLLGRIGVKLLHKAGGEIQIQYDEITKK